VHFIFINRFYWPDEPATAQLLTDLAEALAADGHAVTVITSQPKKLGVPLRELHLGVMIRRIQSTRCAALGLAGKALDFATFYVGALFQLAEAAGRDTVVVALTDPPLIGIGAWMVARLSGARIIHWIQDIYPEVAITLTGHSWPGLVRPLRNLAWRRSDACVTLGTDMMTVPAQAGVAQSKTLLSPNWAPAGLGAQPSDPASAVRTKWNLAGKFVALYSGNLGRVHDLHPLLNVAERLRSHPEIALVFIGTGAQSAALMAEAAQRGLTNVHFHPPQSRGRLAESLALGDVHFVTLQPGCETSVFPSKLYGITAIGRPVIFIGPRPCELARLVTDHDFGRAFARDDSAAVAAAIVDLSRDPARCRQLATAGLKFAGLNGGVARAARQWAALAETVTNA
jgi:colanic acid biosynthesis glycosyl transferase WcaI